MPNDPTDKTTDTQQVAPQKAKAKRGKPASDAEPKPKKRPRPKKRKPKVAPKEAKPKKVKKADKKPKPKKRHGMPFRNECMIMWSEGMSLREIADLKGISLATVFRWKRSHSPENWESFRSVVIREAQDEAITRVRKEFAGIISEELDDVKILRVLARKLMKFFADKIEALDQNGKKKFKLSETEARTLRNITSTLTQIQQQTRRIYGLPTHTIETDTTAETLIGVLEENVDLDNMPDKDIAALLGEQLNSEPGNGA